MIDLSRLWRARLILEDGAIWRATSFGAEGETSGEVVFNTSLSGYQEVLTDPSYHGQVVTMTYPLIGNYGINDCDNEADGPKVAGFIVREACRVPSNRRSTLSIGAYLQKNGIIGLEGLDTRALTRKVRDQGAMKIFMTTETLSDEELREKLAAVPDLVGDDFVKFVTRDEVSQWTAGFTPPFTPPFSNEESGPPRPHVVAFDFGAKSSIFRSLVHVGFNVTVVPASTSSAEVMALTPNGVFLSNGPGDPRPVEYATTAVRELLGKVPIFGICLGHQILAQALGADIVKLKFGHHGSNHPVKDLSTGAVEITAQNHGFAVTEESITALGAEVTHVNLYDGTVEGMSIPDRHAFSVQYHPEASPGPHDSLHLFQRFRELVATFSQIVVEREA